MGFTLSTCRGFFDSRSPFKLPCPFKNQILVTVMESMKTKNVYRDILGFLKVTTARQDLDEAKKLSMIVNTLGHDLNGLLEDEPFFLPRVAGYRKTVNQ